ncbi:hypothetical protein [Actinoplanes sp. NPDC026623]|uniref:hypothetical protein n=1 Tax=Actinoplanes sp. NPDC026623 TaxID=3155610 RepID=UPI0034070DA9
MANTKQTYRRMTAGTSETVTIMAYLGADSGDREEIRRIVERDGAVVEDGIAYFGDSGRQWLDDQHAACLAAGLDDVSVR